jgi:hypothetical protein
MSPTLELIRLAFGPTTTLYEALQSSKNASQADLKRAYHKLALKYHPDKHPSSVSNDSLLKEVTTKFQAVSAAYEVLMDAKRRSLYDATGRVVDDNELHNADDGSAASSSGSEHRRNHPRYKRKRTTDVSDEQQQQRRWDDFFHSVFNEIITPESRHGDPESYRSSRQETEDVLKYYAICKGDLQMVLKCLIHGIEKDVERWRKEILIPAIVRGEIEDYCGIMNSKNDDGDSVHSSTRNMGASDLVDSDEDGGGHEVEIEKKKDHKKTIAKRKRLKRPRATILEDSDEDEEDSCKSGFGTTASLSMNHKDKMEYRVAKKRKLKAKRELEVANIIKSKTWYSGVQTEAGRWKQRGPSGVFSNALLSNMEKKYSKGGNDGTKRKTRRMK